MRRTIMIMLAAMFIASAALAVQPMAGDFDIVIDAETPGLTFSPIPWVSPSGSKVVYLYPFATYDYTAGYSGAGAGYNLATAQFQSGAINVSDGIARGGDLAIRIGNYVGESVTFGATTLTLDLAVQGAFNVYLPQFTFVAMDNIYFWVADNGWTYYANTSKGPGAPNMSAADAIAGGEMYLAAVPEPGSLLALSSGIIGLAGLALRRRRSA